MIVVCITQDTDLLEPENQPNLETYLPKEKISCVTGVWAKTTNKKTWKLPWWFCIFSSMIKQAQAMCIFQQLIYVKEVLQVSFLSC